MPTICICVNCNGDIGGKRPGEDVKCPYFCSKHCESEYAEKTKKKNEEKSS